ncbi:hypothetical protein C1J03_12355 [Sulfitobacter sp. SK012]|uniref:hypothetical protein n=1 Tax=Sulfitobacter sp. SK012 TaxID=1389005 RepID=UPI000E0A1906|nr:hypothetical protein [Sulfitobacter sp. SK012]AXI46743.1 hypothetical protein C1J03_12355 [Sulfitobacter sp. SK012]
MIPTDHNTRCHRVPSPKETLCKSAGFDNHEHILLTAARLYFQSFAEPHSQSWMQALSLTQVHFGQFDGPIIAIRLLTALQAMRCTRRSIFGFNAPQCATCSKVLTEHERRFMTAIQSVRRGQNSVAQLEIMLLCEGNETEHVLAAFIDLSCVLACAIPVAVHDTSRHAQTGLSQSPS